jgi:hypothetical protein
MERTQSPNQPVARPVIPDDWGPRASCPICSQAGLRVRHFSESADQLTCNRCGSSFEIEQNGSLIRLMETAPGLQPFIGGRWISMDEVRLAVRQKSKPNQQPQPEIHLPPPRGIPPNLSTLTATARQLHRLGNSTTDVRKSLKNTAAMSPKQVEEVMQQIDSMERQRMVKQRRTFLVYAIIVLIIIMVVAFAVLVANTLLKEIISSANLPRTAHWIRTLI